ncbi:hypothetical protein C8R45DRAFT_937182 [Mycena sanguinolenta]|nr:hypothetical protein C8R45DRAFT_937182 [Mycena sanguinolenta]
MTADKFSFIPVAVYNILPSSQCVFKFTPYQQPALESPAVQQRRREAKLEAQKIYCENVFSGIVNCLPCRHQVQSYRCNKGQIWALRRAAREDARLEAAIQHLEPEDDESDAMSTSTDDTYLDCAEDFETIISLSTTANSQRPSYPFPACGATGPQLTLPTNLYLERLSKAFGTQQWCGSSLSHIVSNVGGGLSHPTGLEVCMA